MKKLLLSMALAASLVGARSASAAQETINIKGNSCFVTYGKPSYNSWGVYNNSPDFARLNCPVQLPWHPYTSILLAVTGWAYVNDNVNPLSCTLTVSKYDGSSSNSGTVTLPYNPNSSVSGSVTVNSPTTNPFVGISCFLPKTVNFNYDYISSLTVQGFY